MIKLRYVLIFFMALIVSEIYSQGEINATVRINTPQLQKTDRKVFDDLESSLKDFLNNTKWTEDAFEPEERIECNFIITISEEGDNNGFKAELAVQSTRPVYGSGYKTAMLSHLDKDLTFVYEQNQAIEFRLDGNNNQNLPAVMAFYVYIILAMDYDSFSLYGGESYLLKAQQVVNNLQNGNSNPPIGWRPGDGGKNRNRYWIIENLLNPRVKPYRAAMYNYAIKGLDLFSTSPDQGRAVILQSLEEIEKVSTAYFNSMIVQMFSNSKRDELIEMWKLGVKSQRDRVSQIMQKLDPGNGQRYREITN